MVYVVLVPRCQADHKIAIPTSAILLAFTSAVGIGTRLLTGSVQPGTFENRLAAAPNAAPSGPMPAQAIGVPRGA